VKIPCVSSTATKNELSLELEAGYDTIKLQKQIEIRRALPRRVGESWALNGHCYPLEQLCDF